jgi:GntR family transcriptional regulator
MFFQLNPHNGVPLFEQIVRQVKFAIASKQLLPGDRVPSVRDLATQIAVNPNTVAKAYRDLTTEGVLNTLRGEGLEVTSTAPAYCKTERQRLISERLTHVLEEALQSGLSPKDIKQLVNQQLTDSS